MDIQTYVENSSVPVTVVEVNGNIDASTYEKFQAKVEELVAGGARHFLIDLSRVPFVSSAGLRAIHVLFNKLREVDSMYKMSEEDVRKGINAGTYKSHHLKLLNLSKETRTTFELSGFDMFIETFHDRNEAIASFKPAS